MKTDIENLPPVPKGFSPPVKGKLLFLGHIKDQMDIATDFDSEWDVHNWIGSDTGSFYSLRIGSDIYEKNKTMFDEKPKGHPHAALMLEYAKDAAETETPWYGWQGRTPSHSEWFECTHTPLWCAGSEYRRKPTPPATININGFEVPEPLRKEPNYGDEYYTLGALNQNRKFLWQGTALDVRRLQLGLVHLTAEPAMIHTKALVSFTALPDD